MASIYRALLLTVSAATAPLAAQTPSQRQQVRREVQDFVRVYTDAANRGDVTAYTEMYSRQADLITVNDGEIIRGWDALRTQANEMMGLEGSFKISVGSIDVVNIGISRAIAVFPFVMTVTTDQGPVQLRGAMTLVLQKSASWRIIHDHTSTAPAETEPGAA